MEGQELAARHIALREQAGLTQEQEAKTAGVSPTTISGIESGKITRPHLKTLLKIARALGVDVGELRESGKVEAPPSQDRLFNGGSEERSRFIERCRRYVAARVAHYENRLALEKSSGAFAGYKRAQTLQDEAFKEFSSLVDLQGGELLERWLGDPEVPEAAKEELGFDLTDAQEPFIRVVGRIGDRVKELAEAELEEEEAEREKERQREKQRQLEEMREAKRRTA